MLRNHPCCRFFFSFLRSWWWRRRKYQEIKNEFLKLRKFPIFLCSIGWCDVLLKLQVEGFTHVNRYFLVFDIFKTNWWVIDGVRLVSSSILNPLAPVLGSSELIWHSAGLRSCPGRFYLSPFKCTISKLIITSSYNGFRKNLDGWLLWSSRSKRREFESELWWGTA